MFYIAQYTLTDSDTPEAPKEINLELSRGVIHQVDVLFQDGCKFQNYVQIWQGGVQLFPTNRQGAFTGNATVVSFREFYELGKARDILTFKFWTTDASTLGTIVVQIGVLPKKVLQPLSFEELLAAATGIR